MKKVLLSCPDERSDLGSILGEESLSLSKFLGKPLLEHALDELALQGSREIMIVTGEGTDRIRAFVAGGEAWGLRVEVLSESSFFETMSIQEWTQGLEVDHVTSVGEILGLSGNSILETPSGWHKARGIMLPKLLNGQVGVHEREKGIWIGARAEVDDSAQLLAPCWIGPGASVRAEAVVGPNAFVEEETLIDRGAIVEDSTLAERTYLGKMMLLRNSVAGGSTLHNWENESSVEVSDSFFLGRARLTRWERMREKIQGVFTPSNQTNT